MTVPDAVELRGLGITTQDVSEQLGGRGLCEPALPISPPYTIRLRIVPSAPVAVLSTASWRAVSFGLLAVGVGLALAVSVSVLSSWAAIIAAGCYLVAAALIGARGRGPVFGLANAITLTRLVGTCWVGGLAVEAAFSGLSVTERALLIGLGASCLVLDGVDGRVARARGEVSEFGARFDMETDTLLLLWLTLTVPLLGVAGWWVLAIPGLRYGYLAASWVVPALRIPLYYSYSRKVFAVLGAVAVIGSLALDLVWPGWPPSVLLALGLAALSWSFGRDIGWQLRRYREQRTAVAAVR